MEAAWSTETLVSTHKITLWHDPVDQNQNTRRCDNLNEV
jgi:hypothetical protein